MAPPLQEAQTRSIFPDESEAKVYAFNDPTFEETCRNLTLGVGDWTIKGPYAADGSQPIIHVDHRLGRLVLGLLLKFGSQTLSRRESERRSNGELPRSIRIVKRLSNKTTPTAVPNANSGRNEGSTSIKTLEGLNS